MVKVKLADSQYTKFIIYIALLLEEKVLPQEARDHHLKGDWHGYREFHLGGDMLLIYLLTDESLILVRIGTHA